MTRAVDSGERFARLAASIRAEVARLELVVEETRLGLRDFPDAPPPLRELRGLGDVVHDLYTGLERIFERIAVELDGGVPAGAAWHRELLESMALDLPSVRPPVLTSETVRALAEFLRFRHLFRNVYGFELEWPRVKPLLAAAPQVWDAARRDIDGFITFLDAGSFRG